MAAVFGNRQQAQSNNTTNENWKAQAFINLWVPTAGGKRHKLGSIALKDSKQFDAKLIARLQEEGGLEGLMNVLEVDFQMAEGNPVELGF